MANQGTAVGLKDVPETMLWTLHNRATEAMRSDRILTDPKAVEIYQEINYDYERSFGKADPVHALRSLVFDQAIAQFLKQAPDGTIVNLGEGLETQRFRVSDSSALWLTVDLPEAIQAREKFIEPDARHPHFSLSALDRQWFESVPKDKPVFITAQGLFMYFPKNEVRTLIQDIFQTFDSCCLMFDTIPRWFSKKTTSDEGYALTGHYVAPKMPWGINRNQIKSTLSRWLNNDITIEDVGYPSFTRGIGWKVFTAFSSLPILKDITPTIIKVSSNKISN
ncbi:MAG: class I SAM-dependent methyltransferase [Cyanophyceae cyanobacterium]